MSAEKPKSPACFGNLETVFPEQADGLRVSPDACMACRWKTDCLRTAMQGKSGIRVREAAVDRAYASGAMGFVERWSRKKVLKRRYDQQDEGGNPKKENT